MDDEVPLIWGIAWIVLNIILYRLGFELWWLWSFIGLYLAYELYKVNKRIG